MNKNELIASIAEKSDIEPAKAKKALDAITSSITQELAQGGDVQLIGFGTFGVKKRAERQGINPQTREAITIASANVPNFKPGKKIKDYVNA